MKRDYVISMIVFIFTCFVIYAVTRDFFLDFYSNNKIVGGFIKFFFLASIGDFISLRIKEKEWKVPTYMFIKALVWGLIGSVIVLMFIVYPSSVLYLQENNILPFEGVNFFFALFTSLLMNFTFAPIMMASHRVTDTYLNMLKENKKVKVGEVIECINWKRFIRFTVLKTIPLFWVPAHTITFLLPEEYRVIFAAILGIGLGLLLGLFNNKKDKVL